MSANAVAALSGVTLRYGKRTALEALTLDIPARRMVGLIGPDGVGKSSLLALIAGARRIQSGQVQVLGANMASATQRCCARAGDLAHRPGSRGAYNR